MRAIAHLLHTLFLLTLLIGHAQAAGTTGWVLAADQTIVGDLALSGGTLDLNGKTLVVQGNLIQSGGLVRPNGGTLNVLGDYRLQSSCGTTTPARYCTSTGALEMTRTADKVFVQRNFVTESLSGDNKFTAGVLEIQGNFTQYAPDATSRLNFSAAGTHATLFSGSGEQSVFFTSHGANEAHFANLVLRNSSSAGISFLSPVFATVGFVANNSRFVLSNPAQSSLPGYSATASGPVLSIAGPVLVGNGGRANFSAASTTVGGTATTVRPSWSVSPAEAASISADGLLTANRVASDTRVTLSASYVLNGATLTASKIVTVTTATLSGNALSFLNLIGPAVMQSGARLGLMANAIYQDGSTRTVTPVWSSSNPAAALVDNAGIIFAGAVASETEATITARYTENGATASATLKVKIQPSRAKLSSLEIAGPENMQANGRAQFTVVATYDDDSRRPILPRVWSVSKPALATMDSRGFLMVGMVTGETPLILTATHEENGVSVSQTHEVTIRATPAALKQLTIAGGRGTLTAGETLQLRAESRHVDGSRRAVTANWSVSDPAAASITAAGALTAGTVTRDTPMLVTATYTENGVTARAEFRALILAGAAGPPLLAEVEATGERSAYSLTLWFNTNAQAADTRATRAAAAYRLYVGALVPQGQLVGTPTFFILNRAGAWQPLAWPLAEFLSGVEADTWQAIELLDSLDATMISGTQVFIGYGEDDAEMMRAGRYRLVYQVP